MYFPAQTGWALASETSAALSMRRRFNSAGLTVCFDNA
jgi:hypothetical protein